MIHRTKGSIHKALRWTERYIKTDMVYLARGNFWLLVGRAISSGGGFLLTIAFANFLTPEAFGTYKYIVAISGFVAAFTLNSIGGAAMRAIGKGFQNVIPSLFRTALLWSMPASIFALVGGGYYLVKGNGTLGWSLVVIAILNPLLSNLAVSKILFAATGDFRRATIYNSIRSTTQIIVIATALFLTENVLIIASTFFFASALVGYLTYWHSLRTLRVHDDPTHLPETLSYAKHLSALGVLQIIVGQLDQLLLWHFAGPVAVATYAIALGPTRELRSLSENINAIAFPKIAGTTSVNAAQMVQKKSRYLLAVYVVVVLMYAVAAPYFFALLFPQYMSSVLASQILAFGLIFQSRMLADIFLLSHGHIKDRYIVTVPAALLRALLFVCLIPPFGLYGAVWAIVISEICGAFMTGHAYRRHTTK